MYLSYFYVSVPTKNSWVMLGALVLLTLLSLTNFLVVGVLVSETVTKLEPKAHTIEFRKSLT